MFYDILQGICSSRGTTITGMLKDLKLSTSKGSAWKNGSVPDGIILAKISRHFNVSADYLLEIDSDPTIKTDSRAEEIKAIYLQSDEDTRSKLLELARLFVIHDSKKQETK